MNITEDDYDSLKLLMIKAYFCNNIDPYWNLKQAELFESYKFDLVSDKDHF